MEILSENENKNTSATSTKKDFMIVLVVGAIVTFFVIAILIATYISQANISN